MKKGGRRKTINSDPVQNEIHEDDQDADDAQNNVQEPPPKLAEGFFEIEALRKTRIRKGVKQYLIKWRGYPESANTWEPVESFVSCPDVIEAFESMNSGKCKSKRKHSMGSVSHLKKKQQDSPDAAYPKPSVRIEDIEGPCSGPSGPPVHNPNMTENNFGGISYNGTANQSNDLEGKLNEIKATSSMNQAEFLIHIQEEPVEPANGVFNGTEGRRASPRIGARRRKSCAVKRFKNESTKKTTASSDVIGQDDIMNGNDMVNGLDSKNILETPESVPVITKILKPVNYSVSMLNDIEEVCVSFLVARSDGEEIVVDNKYLKENNPVLLINFYEQHLRYNSPSE